MIKSILVVASGGASDTALLGAALTVAKPFGAHIDVLHVRLNAAEAAVAMTTDVGTGALTAGLIDQMERDAREREAKVHGAFTQFCAAAGLAVASGPAGGKKAAPSAEWHVESGDEPRWVATYGLTADLIVAARGDDPELAARPTLEAALIETGRPVLIPAAGAFPAGFERIAIGWKATPQAARAVASAMPFLTRAKDIAVLTVEEQPEEHEETERLLRYLAWHGLPAKAERLKAEAPSSGATLLAAAAQRAQLLVMGGYGHGRLREWVFGGFTQQALSAGPLPILIAH